MAIAKAIMSVGRDDDWHEREPQYAD